MLLLAGFGAGLWLLILSADVFVDQAKALAKRLGVNDFLIGFTVVAMGTSMPELMSTIFSALDGRNDLLVSNIIGSNITNLCLVCGVVALFNQYKINKRDVQINIPLNIAGLLAFLMLTVYTNFVLSWSAGVSLLLIFLMIIIMSKNYNHLGSVEKVGEAGFNLWLMLGSLILMLIAAKSGVSHLVNISRMFGLSESFVGYFLLATGTSLPEMVTTWTAVKKNRGELGLGNILGANLFNLLSAHGIVSFIGTVDLSDYKTDLLFLTGALLVVYFFAIIGKKYSFSRKEGAGLLFIYLMFFIFQISK